MGVWMWMHVTDICMCMFMLLLRLLAYFSLDMFFLSRCFLFFVFIYLNNLKYVYATLDVSQCSYCFQRNFPMGTLKLHCIVGVWQACPHYVLSALFCSQGVCEGCEKLWSAHVGVGWGRLHQEERGTLLDTRNCCSAG